MRVISRTSTMQYKGTHKTMPKIARELKVDGVVEGTVVRVGDRVRIRVQLIDAPDDQHIWAETYERELKDVLVLQASMAREIRLGLTSQQEARVASSRSMNPEAHELYLQGATSGTNGTTKDSARRLSIFRKPSQKIPVTQSHTQA
jgi:hypothetical protein